MFKLYGRWDDPIVKAVRNYMDSEEIEYMFCTLAIDHNLKYLYDRDIHTAPVLFKHDTYIGIMGVDILGIPELEEAIEKWRDTP